LQLCSGAIFFVFSRRVDVTPNVSSAIQAKGLAINALKTFPYHLNKYRPIKTALQLKEIVTTLLGLEKALFE
jgi:hypothetical protein